MKKIFVVLSMVAFLAACDDSSSASAGQNDDLGIESSSSVELGSSSSEKTGKSSSSANDVSSSSEKLSETSSSSVDEVESSSGERDTSQNSAEAKVMPSGTYDCTKYKCVTTEYLNQKYFEAGVYGEILDERDGQVYKTVQIEEQIWMAENLNYETGNSYCYNDADSNCTKYGRLYTWAAAVGKTEDECGYGNECGLPSGNIQGVCPSGWHLSSDTEFETLFTAVGGRSTAGAKLKLQTGWTAYDGITNEDAFGFSALPAGVRYNDGNYDFEGYTAYFWSSTENDSHVAFDMYLSFNYSHANLGYDDKSYGFSVRCVKN